MLSAIMEEDITRGEPLSTNADLDAVPANKEDVVDADNNGAMVVVVIATPDTMGGNNAREVIVLHVVVVNVMCININITSHT